MVDDTEESSNHLPGSGEMQGSSDPGSHSVGGKKGRSTPKRKRVKADKGSDDVEDGDSRKQRLSEEANHHEGAAEEAEDRADATSDHGEGENSPASDDSGPRDSLYADIIQKKIDAGEIDKSIVDSLQLQRLVDGCAVPLGQEVVEQAVADQEEEKRTHLEILMSRPARRQIKEFEGNAYIQGSEEYNIWYNKWSGERTNTVNGRATLMPAMYKCDPERDTGYTRGSGKNTLDDAGTKYCCLFFAKGCCTQGSKCNYLHRVPTLEDEFFLDTSVDIFGRERHAKHRDDMSGVGSFMEDTKTLFVGDVYPDNAEYDPVENLKAVLMEEFGRFGKIADFNLVPAKGIAFVTYESRVIAEFAKVAMASQPLGNYSTALNVKWAHDMKKENKKKGHERAAFEARVKQHESQLEVFQEYFLKNNFSTSGPSAAEQAEMQRAARERVAQRVNKLNSILLTGDALDESQFDVNI
ncbi:pre-mRNA-splicing factor rbm22 like protein [Babesia gibsoni]|uniref:Pre-mRNA-splicing factor rbm22 like protein n=1 Tax=Babesia gibsoni TaxID=33632 RepID=A0AAD8PCU6_BABGI|nr:pre-mRNA-splicing factor rbm22 like protein [Babesia gibsoni]